jgi:GDPmannose 4,6-dehydratase
LIDIADSTNVIKLLYRLQPDEIYHLAAQSHVRVSFDIPEYTGDVTGLGTSIGDVLTGLIAQDSSLPAIRRWASVHWA